MANLSSYTPLGTYAGLLENTRDGKESIKVSSGLLDLRALRWIVSDIGLKITDVARRAFPPILPDVYLENRALLDRFMEKCRKITMLLLNSLSDSLELQGASRFEQSHRSYMPANSSLNLFSYPKSVGTGQFGQNKHTDNGSLTVLLADQPGLQILSPKSGAWGRVLPQCGHAVINVGDTLRFLSGRRFQSSIHRAEPIFEPSQDRRLVVGYFLRAEDETVIEDNEGNKLTARQWHDRKYDNYQAAHSIQRANTVLTGGMEECIEKKVQFKIAEIEQGA